MSIETSKTEKQREKDQKIKQNVQGLWDNYKRYNTCGIGIPEGEERKKWKKYLKQ